jgi:hypothetical protein
MLVSVVKAVDLQVWVRLPGHDAGEGVPVCA